jgi:hypothetical protein
MPSLHNATVKIKKAKFNRLSEKLFLYRLLNISPGLSGIRHEIQGEQKVSLHLMITIQKVTRIVQSVPRQSPDIYWHAEPFSKTVFSIARSAFRMYSVMAIFNSSIAWCLFEYIYFYVLLYCKHQVHRDFWSPYILVLLSLSLTFE